MLDHLRAKLGSYRDEMARFVSELVAIGTENPPGRSYEPCLAAIGRKLDELGFPYRMDLVPGGDEDRNHPRFWLRSEWGETRGPAVYFHGHVDVVPALSPSQLEPRITEDTIFGRGSADMKGGLVAMIYAMCALAESGPSLPGRILLRIVPDEETGGRLGSGALAEKGLLFDDDAVTMLTAEPTGGLVWHASRGAVSCRITVKGRAAHVGLQYRGVNAFENMLTVATALRELKAEVETRRTRFPIEPEAARRSILMMGGEARGGENFNLVPERFEFTVDRRMNPEEDFEEEKARLLETIATVRARGVELDVEVFQEARPAGVSREHPTARALSASIEEVTGRPARFELCPGILEIRFYAAAGIPAFAYGPGLLSVAHGPKEFLKRKDMEDCALVYALTAARVLSKAG